MNNLKVIRELYGATQEQIASAINVNRVTVANWENGNSRASSSNQERLSIYYGVGPEYFYEKELDDAARQSISSTSAHARALVAKSGGKRNKEDDFHLLFDEISFSSALQRYMFATKILLAKADDGDLAKLKTASLINKKMGKRLDAIIKLREEEAAEGEMSLFELLNSSNDV